MKNAFPLLLLLGLLATFSGCQNAEPVDPEADRQAASTAAWPEWCLLMQVVGVDTITTGSYLGFVIGEKASTSYPVMQQHWAQQKSDERFSISVDASDLSQLENSLHLYTMLSLKNGQIPNRSVTFYFQDAKVKSIYLSGQASSLAKWPASEPASLAVAVGDPAETVYQKLKALKEKPQSGEYFKSIYLVQSEEPAGYAPAMGFQSHWSLFLTTGARKADDIQVQFQQGSLSAIYVRHFIY